MRSTVGRALALAVVSTCAHALTHTLPAANNPGWSIEGHWDVEPAAQCAANLTDSLLITEGSIGTFALGSTGTHHGCHASLLADYCSLRD